MKPPNTVLQLTASRARSLLFERLLPARSRQLNTNPLATQAALAHDIAAAIANLAPHYRQVLLMRDVQLMSAPEVAATLGMTVAAVKSRLHRARVLVRASLQGWEDRDTLSE